ncbi:hypothetical protein ACFX11_034839 [Malus domestica]
MIMLSFHSFDLELKLLEFFISDSFCWIDCASCISLSVLLADVVDEEEAQDDEDEYSRARLGKQSGRGSKQSVPDQKIAFLLLVLQVRTKTRKMTRRMHDMRYSCFLPS